jgi:hypothetical protein
MMCGTIGFARDCERTTANVRTADSVTAQQLWWQVRFRCRPPRWVCQKRWRRPTEKLVADARVPMNAGSG